MFQNCINVVISLAPEIYAHYIRRLVTNNVLQHHTSGNVIVNSDLHIVARLPTCLAEKAILASLLQHLKIARVLHFCCRFIFDVCKKVIKYSISFPSGICY